MRLQPSELLRDRRNVELLGLLRDEPRLGTAGLGYPVSAFVRVRPGPGRLSEIAELARSMPQVVECHRVTGEDCFVLKVHLPSIDALDRALDRFLAHGQTTTSIIQSTPVPSRGLPLPGGLEP